MFNQPKIFICIYILMCILNRVYLKIIILRLHISS